MAEAGGPLTLPGLTCLPGLADSRPVSLLGARYAIAYWERAVDQATDKLLDSPIADLGVARYRLFSVHDRLQAARNRLDRIVAEGQGLRWLWVAGENADG